MLKSFWSMTENWSFTVHLQERNNTSVYKSSLEWDGRRRLLTWLKTCNHLQNDRLCMYFKIACLKLGVLRFTLRNWLVMFFRNTVCSVLVWRSFKKLTWFIIVGSVPSNVLLHRHCYCSIWESCRLPIQECTLMEIMK